MLSKFAKALKLRLNRRYFWIGFAIMAGVIALVARSHPSILNGGFVLPWVLLHGARMHDFGRSVLWAIGVVSAVLFLLSALAVARLPVLITGSVAILLFLAFVAFSLWVGAKRGDSGENRFGRPPAGWRFA